LIALPLIHTAWLTALLGAVIHCRILSRRLQVEESILGSNPAYRAAMGSKPRFLPKLFQTAAKSPGEGVGRNA
jgi:methyltransferase